MEWYYSQAGVPAGPVNERDFQGLLAAGALDADSMVWHPGLATWQRYGQMFRRGAFFIVPSPGAAAPEPVWHYFCSECGRPFTADNLISFGEARVCAGCKPTFYQRVREGAALPRVMNYAEILPRFGAWFVDGVIIFFVKVAVQALIVVPFMPLIAPPPKPGQGFPVGAMLINFFMLVLAFTLSAAYDTWFVGRFEATPGKMAFGLKVIRPDGGHITYMRALGRHFAEMLSRLTLYIGFLIAAFDDERRALHDRLADTRVVKAR